MQKIDNLKLSTKIEPILPKGEIVTCPNCGIEIAEVLEDLYIGDMFKYKSFMGISQEIHSCICKKCNEEWATMSLTGYVEVHLKYGWNTPTPNSIRFIKSLC